MQLLGWDFLTRRTLEFSLSVVLNPWLYYGLHGIFSSCGSEADSLQG